MGGVIVAVIAALAPPASAYGLTIRPGDYLMQRTLPYQPPGTGRQWIKNSAGTILGSYRLWAEVGSTSRLMRITQLCVSDELANGRGVVLRVMVKHGLNSSKDIGYFKDRADCYSGFQVTSPEDIWALDVDHGEAWGSTTYRYAGHYDRYQRWDGSYSDWPCFD